MSLSKPLMVLLACLWMPLFLHCESSTGKKGNNNDDGGITPDTDLTDHQDVLPDPPTAVILLPEDTVSMQEGRTLELAGSVEGGAPPLVITWDIDGMPVAEGTNPGAVQILASGRRTLRLHVVDDAGREASDTVELELEDLNGGLFPYYGNLHSHSALSDGEGSPEQVLTWARDDVGVDFYAMTDHAEQLSSSDWDQARIWTDAFNENGVFVTLRGFEWSHPWNGHICIFETEARNAAYNSYWITYIYDWIEEHNGLAQFNHPGRENGVFNNLKLEPNVKEHFFGIETGNKNTGNNDGEFIPYYIMALDKGWHVAPTSNQDNHSMKMNSHRTVYWGPELSREELLTAMRARRLYSSDDPNIEVMFRTQNAFMGEVIEITSDEVEFLIKVVDDEPILRLELITRGGHVATSYEPPPGSLRAAWFPTVHIPNDTYFFLKVISENLHDGDDPTQVVLTAPIRIHPR